MIEHKNAKDMKRKAIFTIALFLMSLATYATGQDGDVISIDGTQWTLLGQPISRDTVLWRQVRAAIPQQHVVISSNWSACPECIPAETLQRVFKNYFDGKQIVAGWLKGDIRVGKGKMLYYEHIGYERNYEEEQIISIDHGRVNDVKVFHNHVVDGFSFDQGRRSLPMWAETLRVAPAQLREMFPLHVERYPELANVKRIVFTIRRAKVDETGHLVECEVKVLKPCDNKQLAAEMEELMKAYHPWRVSFINGEYRADGIERYTFSYPLE